MVNYDHIELSPEEIEEAIYKAKAEKDLDLRQKEYIKKLTEPKTYHKFTYETLRAFLTEKYNIINANEQALVRKYEKEKIKHFVLDEFNENIFEMLCMYFTADPGFEFQNDNFSLDKGIMLYGPVGCGKTTMIKMFQMNSYKPFIVNPCRLIADEYAKDGSDALNKYSELQAVYPQQTFGIEAIGRLYDDLGTEDNKSHFGNKVNVMQDIFYKIYENELTGMFHVTTNITGDQIGEFYGVRIKSRIREMYNVIQFNGKSPDRRR